MKLLLKWPNLYYSTSAFAPKYYPKDIVDFANTRGADKVMYAGYYPMGLSLERIFKEMPDVPVPRPRVAEVPARERVAALRAARRDGSERSVRCDATREGRDVVDTAVGFPRSREEMYEFYEFIRKGSHDQATQSGEGELEFPAGYMFKDVAEVGRRRDRRPVSACCSAILDAPRHPQAVVGVEDDIGKRAVRDFPDRFFPSISIDPNEGMERCARSTATPTSSTCVPSARFPRACTRRSR